MWCRIRARSSWWRWMPRSCRAGLVPARDAIGREAADGPYANLIAVRTKDRDQPWVKKLVAAYQSPEVRAYIEKEFKGSLIPAV
ncbi:hypothetical protein G6F21_014577 [Rhizopus arrhizus]|nr:hypothetical protein G6F21_014577 [Rhizopus arrhizus]